MVGKKSEVALRKGFLIVTSKQLLEGYKQRVGDRVSNKKYTVVTQLADGNYVVKEPKSNG